MLSDKKRLMQVLLNLTSNAFKFTFNGGIKISARASKISRTKCIEFCVEDTGIGIKQEDQQKLFKLFSMISDEKTINTNGWGIGLTIWKKFIEILGGTIEFKSEWEKGTKVIFKIPITCQNHSNIWSLRSFFLKETPLEPNLSIDFMSEWDLELKGRAVGLISQRLAHSASRAVLS